MDSIKQAVQETVNGIYREQGEVKPSVLVDSARPETSPIHDAFEWNDAKAGEEYRLIQARQWIRRVEIVVEDRKEKFIHIPVMAAEDGADTDTREGSYKPVSVVVRTQDEYQRALSALLSRLEAAKASLDDLQRASETKKKRINRRQADKGFKMIESAVDCG